MVEQVNNVDAMVAEVEGLREEQRRDRLELERVKADHAKVKTEAEVKAKVAADVNPIPYALHLTPYTLHPTFEKQASGAPGQE